MKSILEGTRVLEWARFIGGPGATQILGDLGAEVIKIERRGVGDEARVFKKVLGIQVDNAPEGRNYYFELFNRHKKSISIDLEKEQGREIIYRLVDKADVFLTNFRERLATKLGLDYKTLSRRNPRLVYAQGTGFGTKGPERDSGAFDQAVQARAGVLQITKEIEELGGIVPQTTGLADVGGAMCLACGVIAALLGRERLGIGQKVEGSLYSSLLWTQLAVLGIRIFTGKDFILPDITRPKNPLYSFYKASDGKWVCLAMGAMADKYWPDFCTATGIQELEKDERFSNILRREENTEEITSILKKVFAQKPREEWLKILKSYGIIAQPVNNTSDVIADPQALENEYIKKYEHPVFGDTKLIGLPFDFSVTPVDIRAPAPELGQHTEEILENCGYTFEQIQKLKEQEVI